MRRFAVYNFYLVKAVGVERHTKLLQHTAVTRCMISSVTDNHTQ